jgi:nucleoside-diphosphate-sugar epimerase
MVVSFDIMEPDPFLREFLGDDIDRIVFEQGDVTDRATLRAAAERHGVTSIVSAAAITPRIDRERQEADRIIAVNLGGVVNALEIARELPRFRRFVQISSVAVYGVVSGAEQVDEDSPANATDLYGITKLAGERVALRYGELFDLDVIAVRPSNVYGPMERFTPGYAGATELREMLRLHFEGKPILVESLDASYRDWVYAEDVADGIMRAWATPGSLPHRVFLLSGNRQYSVGEVLAHFAQHVPGLEFRVVAPNEANYAVDVGRRAPDRLNRRAAEELGWNPRTTLAEGMREYLAWIMAHGPQ